MPPKIKGNPTYRQLRPRRQLTADSSQIIVPFTGLYSALEAAMPPINGTLPGFPAAYKVSDVKLEEGRSLEGRMVVTLEAPRPGDTGTTDTTELADPIYELDWGEERRPLEEHSKCGKLFHNRPAYRHPSIGSESDDQEQYGYDEKKGSQRTWDHWEVLEENDYDEVSGGWSLAEYKALRAQGYTDYPVSFPIARVTKYARYRMASPGGVWARSNPPTACGAPSPAIWTYVKTASRSSKQGRLYSLIEEWRGYDKADALFFL